MPEHRIYEGHFPGNPVVPGVCSLHMITECAAEVLGYPVVISQAPVVKFLGIVRPSSDKDLEIDLQMNEMALKATITSGERVVMSCKAKLGKIISS
jgi:3-hydroxyacyl-[acyl-carrier-protein] dehydratase